MDWGVRVGKAGAWAGLLESLQRQNQGDLWGTECVFGGEGGEGHDSKGFSLSNWEKGDAI